MRTSLFSAFAAILAAALLTSCGTQKENNEFGYEIKDGVIVYNTPERPSDQISMIGFAVDPIDTVRIGFIGLG